MGAPGRSEEEGVLRIRAGWGRNPGAREPQGYLPGQEWAVQPQKESLRGVGGQEEGRMWP